MDIDAIDLDLPHGITLSCRTSGRADAPRRIVMLHGFPEAAFVWDPILRALGSEARCVAPNLRGYERSSAPSEVAAYRAKHLVQDIDALIQQLGGRIDVLVAHDWGGALAWNLAALRPQLLRQLVIINSPHPGALARELRDSPEQQAASAYMNALVREGMAEQLIADDCAPLFALLQRGRDASWLTPALRERYREAWSHGLNGALNYYRASPLRPPKPGDDSLHRLQLPESVLHVNVPTTVLWGLDDVALRPSLLDGLEQWVAPLRVQRVPGASHWIVHERPELVTQVIRAALDDPR